MQLGSILISGVEKITKVLLRDFEIVLDSGDRMGSAKLLVLYNPATETDIAPGRTVSIYSTDSSSESGLWGGEVFGEPLFGSGSASVPVFAGTITNIECEVMVAKRVASEGGSMWGDPQFGGPMFGEGTEYERVNVARIECRDWNSLLESGIVDLGTSGFTSKTDKYIITALFGAVVPEVDLSNVASTATLSTFDQVEGQSLRSILGRLSEMTGAIYYIDAEKKLHWFLPTARPSPWSVSEAPDGVASFPFDRNTFRYIQEWRTPANKVTVMGAVSTGGVRVSSTRTNPASITAYGTIARTISDRTITSTGAAQARADVELANYSTPQINGKLTLRKSGLNVGQLLTIDASTSLQFSGDYVIRRITLRWWSRSITNYDVEWGSYLPDLARAIRLIYDQAQNGQPAGVQPTTPAPQSVDTPAYVPGSVDNATLGAASVGTANIQNAAVTNAQIGSAAVGTANIQTAAITSALIGSAQINDAHIASLSADKLTAGNVTVGGSGVPGQLIVRDAGSGAQGYIGGTTDGGWLKALAIGGSGVGSAKVKVGNTGVVTIAMDGGDSFTVTSGSLTVTVNGSGVKVQNGSNYSLILQDGILTTNGSNSTILGLSGSTPALSINSRQVVGAYRSGWTAPSGTATRSGYTTSTATAVQVAEALKALIDDLTTHGLIGA
jgi:hypothetical protein